MEQNVEILLEVFLALAVKATVLFKEQYAEVCLSEGLDGVKCYCAIRSKILILLLNDIQ